MPASRLASESDIQDTDILTTGAATLIRTTDTTGRTTMVGRPFIGITDTECTTRVRIIVTTATGGKTNQEKFSRAGGCNIPPAYFFGVTEVAGDVVDEPAGDVS
jgi:hypothetical protein